MRTIIVVALAVGPLAAGTLATPAVAAPEDQSTAVSLGKPRHAVLKHPLTTGQHSSGAGEIQRTKRWKSVNGSRYVSASGTISFNRRTSRYTIRGTLKDSRKDGWAAGIDFFIGDAGAPRGIIQPLTLLKRSTRKPHPGPGKQAFTYRAPFGIHAGVRECLVQVKRPYKRKCGRWISIARSGYQPSSLHDIVLADPKTD
jgi:hypothetical protein